MPVIKNGEATVEMLVYGSIPQTIAEAHIRLISLAPEMAEALDNFVAAAELPGAHCEMEQAVRHARALLAKLDAEG